jgi:parallel beta-helix repeat protein
VFHDIKPGSGSGALMAYGAKNTRVERNVFQSITGTPVYLRGADYNVFTNNLIYGNSGQAVYQYSTIDADLPVGNRFINNTIVNNAGGGLELDSMGVLTTSL